MSRYGAVARLFLEHRSALAAGASSTVRLSASAEGAARPRRSASREGGKPDTTYVAVADDTEPVRLAADLEKLGPTFVKLGQLLSTRSDLLPPAYLEALSRLQDDVDPVPASEIEKIIEEELGVRVSKAFAWFDPEPLASAALGQVHRAMLREGQAGHPNAAAALGAPAVAVKVQRPGIVEQIKADLDALDEIAALVDHHTETGRRYEFGPMVLEFRKALMVELDYAQEANHLRTLGRNLAEFERIIVPEPVDSYTSSRVLTMDYVSRSAGSCWS